MPFFKQSPAEKFTPKTIKLSKLYHANTGGKALSGSAFINAQKALTTAGYSDSQIRKVLFKDAPISVSEMRTIASALNKGRVYGFEKTPATAIKSLLNKERIKAQSISRINKEHILEAAEEDISSPKSISSLNQKGISPNAPKPGEPSILSRLSHRDHGPNVTASLSDKSKTRITSSYKNTDRLSGSINRTNIAGTAPKLRY